MQNVVTVDVVGVGLNATDTLIALDRFPSIGQKVEFQTVHVLPGGQTASAVVACQTWGLQTRYVGKLGDDAAAAIHRAAFDRVGVEAQILTAENTSSAQSIILVDGTGERTVLLKRDERLSMHPKDLRRSWIAGSRALHVDGFDTAAATQAALWAREDGTPVIGDLDEIYPGVEHLLPLIDHLIVSRDFPARLTGEADLEKALKWMRAEYGNRITAATLGHDGVLAWDGEEFHYRPAYLVPVVDTTGAGDMFHAAYIYGLLAGWELDRQLDFACAAAALNCTAPGARGGIRSVDAIETLMETGTLYPVVYPAPSNTVFA
jgi:sugar/nucleoside kinase (ribokinase family)